MPTHDPKPFQRTQLCTKFDGLAVINPKRQTREIFMIRRLVAMHCVGLQIVHTCLFGIFMVCIRDWYICLQHKCHMQRHIRRLIVACEFKCNVLCKFLNVKILPLLKICNASKLHDIPIAFIISKIIAFSWLGNYTACDNCDISEGMLCMRIAQQARCASIASILFAFSWMVNILCVTPLGMIFWTPLIQKVLLTSNVRGSNYWGPT